MATRCFGYNPTQASISGATLYGTLAVESSPQDYSSNPGGIVWWMGPEEDTYVIAGVVPSSDFPNWWIGSIGGNSYYMNAYFGEMKVFDKRLTASEVLAEYNNTSNRYLGA